MYAPSEKPVKPPFSYLNCVLKYSSHLADSAMAFRKALNLTLCFTLSNDTHLALEGPSLRMEQAFLLRKITTLLCQGVACGEKKRNGGEEVIVVIEQRE